MLIAYFDESGTDGQRTSVSVTGAIAPEEEWRRIEPLWTARLAEDGIRVFHAADCELCIREFRDIQYWSRGRKDSIFGNLGRIIRGSSLHLLGMQIAMHSWREAFKRATSPYAFIKPPRNPYIHAFGMSLSQAIGFIENSGTDCGSVVFAEQLDFLPDVKPIIAQFRSQSEAVACGKIDISFASPRNVIGLQIADFLSFEFYRKHSQVLDYTRIRVRPFDFTMDGLNQDLLLATADRLRAMYLQPVQVAFPPLRGHLLPYAF